jgi:dUTP pyrophosphatase
VIDNGFRGELLAFVHNVSDDKYTVTIGKAVVQLVLFPMVVPPVEVVNDLGTSIRGIAGFGSTDTVGE